ncbi:MAG: DUF4129 domain-containing protein [Flavobacteriales bacterium]|nr:DUF4129 domain-containing protein [Flavobacteriales bacterium]
MCIGFCMLFQTVLFAQDDFVVIDGDTLYYENEVDNVESESRGFYDENGDYHTYDQYDSAPEEIKSPDPADIQKSDPWENSNLQKARGDLDYLKPEEKPKKKKPDPQPETQEAPETTYEEPEIEGAPFLGSAAAQVIVISIVVVILAWLIYRLMASGGNFKDKRISITPGYSLDEIEENLHESDLDKFLRMALDAGDFKSAVRLYYLNIIKGLHERKFIVWAKEKTNFDYVAEMRPRAQFHSFRDLTRAFEFIWYGDVQITAEQYQAVEPVFRSFLEQLNDKANG